MKRSVSLLSLICLPLLAQIGVPKIGVVRYSDGSFHTVQGLPANMIVADLPLDPADAASFSDSGGLIAQNGAIRLLAPDFSAIAEYPVAEKPLLAMDGGPISALAWLPKAHTLLHWNGSKFDAFELGLWDINGTVTDIESLDSRQARMIVVSPDNNVSGVTVSLRTGNLVSSETLPGVHGYAFSQGFLIVYASEKELVADNLRGYRRSVPLPAPDFVIERMSNTWLHLYSPSLQRNWALHITRGDLDLSILPGLPEKHIPSSVAVAQHPEVK
jgi:hypothetical protein